MVKSDESKERLLEFYRLFFTESEDGWWTALLDKPLSVTLPLQRQAEHLFKHAYLDECNLAFAKMYGYDSPGEMVGFRFPQLLKLSDRRNLDSIMGFLKEGYKVFNVESSELTKSGETRYFLNSAVGIVRDGLLRRIWGWQRDMTEQKLRELRKMRSLQDLTPEQLSILRQTILGKTLKEIGTKLKRSPKTVATLRSRLMRKLGAMNLPELIRRAVEIGIDLEP